MFEKIRKMKNKKGFTLVELIVVLVILAILAALLVPALTKYIDKANEEKATSECRMVVMAAQTAGTEYYAKNDSLSETGNKKPETSTIDFLLPVSLKESETSTIDCYSELPNANYTVTYDTSGKVKSVVYTTGVFTCTYTAADSTNASKYEVKKNADPKATTKTVTVAE